MSSSPLFVLKFGSSVLTGEEQIALAVHEIYRYLRRGHRVLAVVSALGDTTDRLVAQARRFGAEPEPQGLATLVATGESTAAALLTLALDQAGVPATLLDPRQAGLETIGEPLDAEPCTVDAACCERALAARPVAVFPGFFGVRGSGGVGGDAGVGGGGGDGGVALLGRGGSDLTAFYLADRLGASGCRLVKDVDGLYERDPAARGAASSRRFVTIRWEDAMSLGTRVVQAKALRFAARQRLSFEVSAPGVEHATVVGIGPTRLAAPGRRRPPLRVALLGLGTVGLGVYRHLAAQPDRFRVVGIAVRSVERHYRSGVPPTLLSADPWRIAELDSDVVVEALGGREPATSLIAAALAAGRHVITANKLVVAESGPWLARQAVAQRVELRFAAAVGGGVPAVEAVTRLAAGGAGIQSVSGVLNGTTNFVLDQIAAGSDLRTAVRLAQERGFAEADPGRDLDGSDAAWKLRILARAAFGIDLAAGEIACRGIRPGLPCGGAGEGTACGEIDLDTVRTARARGRVVRLVASCRREGDRITAEVGPLSLPAGDPLAATRNEENRIVITLAGGGSVLLSGKGAGRWPTSESVLADLLDLDRPCRAQPAARGARLAVAAALPPAGGSGEARR
jgi:homoserine dehydrogenase